MRVYSVVYFVLFFLFTGAAEGQKVDPVAFFKEDAILGLHLYGQLSLIDQPKEFGVKRITKEIIEKVTNILEGEVKTYDQYLTGDVYGYKVFKVSECSLGHEHKEEVDSCWGFYGEEECMSEGEGIVEYYMNLKENEVVNV